MRKLSKIKWATVDTYKRAAEGMTQTTDPPESNDNRPDEKRSILQFVDFVTL